MRTGFRQHVGSLLVAIDLVGTALFAAEGASTATAVHLDLLGIFVLAFVTAVGGGIVRDLILGDVPPPSIRDWKYAAIAFAAGVFVFLLHLRSFGFATHWLILLDAAGLSFFAVAGATKAMEYGLHPLPSILLGGITGVGGGTLRDLLISRVPDVLTSDVYASAALFGSLVTVLLLKLKVRPAIASVCGITACFVLRVVAVRRGWNLPGARR